MAVQVNDGSLFWATGMDNSGLQSGSTGAMNILSGLKGKVGKLGIFAGLSIGAVLAFSKIIKEAHKFEKQFETAMREVGTLSDEIYAKLGDVGDQVIDLTTTIPILGVETAKALYQIVSAGNDLDDAMEILEVSGKGAIAGLTDTATAADTLTTILNAYGKSGKEASYISDLVFETVKRGKTTFNEIGASIANVAAIAANFGVEIEQVLGGVATLTKQGVPTAQAMTQIRAAILGVGEVLGDAAFESNTLQEAFIKVREEAGGSNTKLREMLGRVEALNGVLGMTGNNAKVAAEDLKGMGESMGAAQGAFEKMVVSEENQGKLFLNNLIALIRPAGKITNKMMTAIASGINRGFAKMRNEFDGFDATVTIAEKSLQRFDDAMVSEVSTLNMLFERLKSANKGSALRAEVIERINENYADYLPNLISESDTLEDIAKYQEVANTQLRESLALKFQMEAVTDIVQQQVRRESSALSELATNNKTTTSVMLQAFEEYYRERNEIAFLSADELAKIDKDLATELTFDPSEGGTVKMEKLAKDLKIPLEYLETQFKQLEKARLEDGKALDIVNNKYKAFTGVLGEQIKTIKGAGGGDPIIPFDLEAFEEELDKAADAYKQYSELQTETGKKAWEEINEAYLKDGRDFEAYLEKKLKAYEKNAEAIIALEVAATAAKIDLRPHETPSIPSRPLSEARVLPHAWGASIEAQEKMIAQIRNRHRKAESQAERDRIQTQLDLAEEYLQEIKGKKKEEADLYEKLTINIEKLSRKALKARIKDIDTQMRAHKKTDKEYEDLLKARGALEQEMAYDLADAMFAISDGIMEMANLAGVAGGELDIVAQKSAEVAAGIFDIVGKFAAGDTLGGALGIIGLMSTITELVQNLNKAKYSTSMDALEGTLERINRLTEANIRLLRIQRGEYDATIQSLTALNSKYATVLQSIRGERFYTDTSQMQFSWYATLEDYVSVLESGVLSDDSAARLSEYVMQLISLREEIIAAQNELLGTSSSDLAGAIVDVFDAGIDKAEEFGKVFDDVIKNAIRTMITSQLLTGPLQGLIDHMAALSEGGFSESEIAALRGMYNTIVGDFMAGAENANLIFGDLLGGDIFGGVQAGQQGLAGAIRQQITEETGTLLAGIMGNMQLNLAQSLAEIREMAEDVKQIEFNTRYNQYLESIDSKLDYVNPINVERGDGATT